MRNKVRPIIVAFVVGVVTTGAALAGTLVGPLRPPADERAIGPVPIATGRLSAHEQLGPDGVAGVLATEVRAPASDAASATFSVGASRVSLSPAPTLFGGGEWMTDGCTSFGVDGDNTINQDHAIPSDPAELRSWPASSPDCIYLGGFGLGPVRPATRVGNGGVWIRSVAISNGKDTFVYQIADLVGWFARYDEVKCTDCGILDVRTKAAEQLGIPVGNIVTASTHSHATADTYGGWGGIPDWYRRQIRDSAIAGAKQAVANLQGATIEVGETQLRRRNNERRDTYYSTADTSAAWLQAKTLPQTVCTGKNKKEVCTSTSSVIASLATFAAHPTIVNDNILHADWPGAAARRFEAAYGGVGLMFEGGLGNVSVSGLGGASDEERAEKTGIAIANDIASDIARNATRLSSTEMGGQAQTITHPVATNPGITTLGTIGLFDRELVPGTPGAGPPGAYHFSREGEFSTTDEEEGPGNDRAFLSGCDTAGPTVITTAGAHRIGELLIAFAPGEIFSNISEVVRERADQNTVAMTFGQANDALGYIIQSFEFDYQGNAITEYGTGTGEYEEVFSIDHCFGDHVLHTILESTDALNFGG